MYHQSLLQWWKKEGSDIAIPLKNIPFLSFFTNVFKQYPPHILLLSTDGRIGTILKMEDPIPPDFKIRRYMKMDNSFLRVSTIIPVLFQLLSIDIEDDSITLFDFIGFLQFLISLQTENSHIQFDSELTGYLRNQFYNGVEFCPHWKKKYRDPILHHFFQCMEEKETETAELVSNLSLLEHIQSCHGMIEKLSATLALQDERISWLEGNQP
jgi:hypothetical protein